MKIDSLSYSTLLHVLSFTCSIEEKQDYLIIKTSDNPGHHWGNFLMFPNPPQEQDYKSWVDLFKMEFSDLPIKHIAFAWDSIDGRAGEIKAFENAGYYFEYDDILIASSVFKPEKYNEKLIIQPIVDERDWELAVQLNIDCAIDHSKAYAESIKLLMARYRELCFANQCTWMGAYLNDQLMADLGLFKAGDSRGLAAHVKTHPDFRKQGICRTLLYEASQLGFNQMNIEKIIMVADRAYGAGRVYGDVGYKEEERGASLILNSI